MIVLYINFGTGLTFYTDAQVLFTKRMDAVMAEEFGEATLETEVCLESGEVQWMRQGVVIQPGPRHKLTQNGCKRSLTISNLNLSDRGTYRCETLHDRTQVKLNVERKWINELIIKIALKIMICHFLVSTLSKHQGSTYLL